MKSSNEKGNPFHDEEGKFTSGEGASSGKKEYKPTPEKGSFAAEWLKSLTNKVEEEDPVGDLLGKLKKMNAVGEEEVSEETKSKLGDMGFKDKEESGPRTFVDNWGKEHKLDGSGYEVFSNEDGSFTIQDGTFVLAKFNSVDELPEAGFTEDEIKELTTEGSLYFPSQEEQEREQASKLFGIDLSKNQPKKDLSEVKDPYVITLADVGYNDDHWNRGDLEINPDDVAYYLAYELPKEDRDFANEIANMSDQELEDYIYNNYDELVKKYDGDILVHFANENKDYFDEQVDSIENDWTDDYGNGKSYDSIEKAKENFYRKFRGK